MKAAQHQYLSKGDNSRWINIEEYEVANAQEQGFETRELFTHSAPSWIVNDHGELGVLVNGQAYFMYKGQPLQYKGEEDSPTRFRYVEKREFGESGPTIDPQVDAHDWMTLPGLARDINREPKYFLSHGQLGRKQVTKAEWIQAERAAGFRPKCASDHPAYWTQCATGGFSSGNISGSITY